MKKLSLGFLVLMSLVIASCGGDNKSGDGGSSNVNMNAYGQVQSVTGTINFSQSPNIFQAANGQFTIMDQSGIMGQAYQQAFYPQGHQPSRSYSVTIRGIFQTGMGTGNNPWYGNNQGWGNQQWGNQTYGQGSVQVQSATIRR